MLCGTWEELYASLGAWPPTEYTDLMTLCGSGMWSRWLCFHTPLWAGGAHFRSVAVMTADGLVDTLLAWQRGVLGTAGLPGVEAGDDPLEIACYRPWNDACAVRRPSHVSSRCQAR